MFIKISLIAILLMSIVIPFGGFLLTKRKEKNFKISLFTNLFVFTITLIIANIIMFNSDIAFAGGQAAHGTQRHALCHLGRYRGRPLSCVHAERRHGERRQKGGDQTERRDYRRPGGG